jgi:hypothetical protein
MQNLTAAELLTRTSTSAFAAATNPSARPTKARCIPHPQFVHLVHPMHSHPQNTATIEALSTILALTPQSSIDSVIEGLLAHHNENPNRQSFSLQSHSLTFDQILLAASGRRRYGSSLKAIVLLFSESPL